MAKSLLVTRPNSDPLTNYLYYWTQLVLEEAQNKQFRIYKLDGVKVTKDNFKSYVARNLPSLIFLNGHGAKDRITGYGGEVLVDINTVFRLLKQYELNVVEIVEKDWNRIEEYIGKWYPILEKRHESAMR